MDHDGRKTRTRQLTGSLLIFSFSLCPRTSKSGLFWGPSAVPGVNR